jgi:hypothetical protein
MGLTFCPVVVGALSMFPGSSFNDSSSPAVRQMLVFKLFDKQKKGNHDESLRCVFVVSCTVPVHAHRLRVHLTVPFI